jgi:hypothetical protein
MFDAILNPEQKAPPNAVDPLFIHTVTRPIAKKTDHDLDGSRAPRYNTIAARQGVQPDTRELVEGGPVS